MRTNRSRYISIVISFIFLFAFSLKWINPNLNSKRLEAPLNFEVKEQDVPLLKLEIGSEDDPNARFNYHINLQLDPKTGEIPFGIYQRELQFTSKIPSIFSRVCHPLMLLSHTLFHGKTFAQQ